jgi:hypothetical protein
MADLLTDDGRPWAVDGQRLDEIALLTDVMIEATTRSGPLTQAEIDGLLAHAARGAGLAPGERHPIPHPRRGDAAAR